jgi:hypothetical protein
MRDFGAKLVPLLEDGVRVMIYAGGAFGGLLGGLLEGISWSALAGISWEACGVGVALQGWTVGQEGSRRQAIGCQAP